MALKALYTIVPFLRGAGSRLHPGTPRHAPARDAAISEADRLAPFYAGVIVLKDRSDLEQEIFLEPVLACVIGDVPDTLWNAGRSAGRRAP